MSTSSFTTLFLVAVLAGLAVRIPLALRHARHVSAHRNAVPPAFATAIGLDAHRKAADYTVARVHLGLVDLLVSTVWLLILTLGGGLQALFDLSAGVLDAGSLGQGVAFLTLVAVASWLVDLPLGLYRSFVLEARFGFNRLTPRLFVADTLKGALLAALIGLPLLAGALWLMGAMGEHWWLWVWAAWLGFNLLAMLIYPSFIAPLFNRFQPLEDGDLKTRIEALMTRCGFRLSGLFVMDGSKRSAHGNAYFTGFGGSRRIVFFDTLLEKLDPAEVEAVLAHELGHYHHHHLWKRLAVIGTGSLAFFALLGALAQQGWFFTGLGMTATGAAPTLVLFSLALPVFTFPLTPLMSHWSRRHEFEADAYAARQAPAASLISALVKLYRDNASTLTPDPLYSRVYDSHPPAAVRIARLEAAVR
ncbi:MAG TPA: M48 family metallopeptidase [Rhodocyclaceae bacterium]|uniref:M48 family metallopeptidase n=1 Tax=Zoogloea sp. TaxID=49181 RepID=UPI002BB424F5|nr:M48 family metallopeptidase [Zoogloea sp.]HMV64163.1 M48 family metallopeptidase [Rhodocyclaceae bacterium]HNH15502.1 M48 family metallopeptidase [Zoogloea sp.]HNI80901.1 M48 family metallopeptidase [Rhodocyclaceae bacterium]